MQIEYKHKEHTNADQCQSATLGSLQPPPRTSAPPPSSHCHPDRAPTVRPPPLPRGRPGSICIAGRLSHSRRGTGVLPRVMHVSIRNVHITQITSGAAAPHRYVQFPACNLTPGADPGTAVRGARQLRSHVLVYEVIGVR